MPARGAATSSKKPTRFIVFLLLKILSTTCRLLQLWIRLLRQLRPGLLRHHIFGVPVGPVRIGGADELLVLAVRDRGTAHCVRQIVPRREGRRRRVYAAGQARGDLLEQPAIAVGIFERGERAVAAMLWIGAADADAPK